MIISKALAKGWFDEKQDWFNLEQLKTGSDSVCLCVSLCIFVCAVRMIAQMDAEKDTKDLPRRATALFVHLDDQP